MKELMPMREKEISRYHLQRIQKKRQRDSPGDYESGIEFELMTSNEFPVELGGVLIGAVNLSCASKLKSLR